MSLKSIFILSSKSKIEDFIVNLILLDINSLFLYTFSKVFTVYSAFTETCFLSYIEAMQNRDEAKMEKFKKKKTFFPLRITKNTSGFTLIELLVAMILFGILVAIAYTIYSNYLNKARIAIAESTLDHARDNLELYSVDNGKYPESINFSNCTDENGGAVFTKNFCNQLAEDLIPESYVLDNGNYILKARDKDHNKTLITLTMNNIKK